MAAAGGRMSEQSDDKLVKAVAAGDIEYGVAMLTVPLHADKEQLLRRLSHEFGYPPEKIAAMALGVTIGSVPLVVDLPEHQIAFLQRQADELKITVSLLVTLIVHRH